MVRRPRHHDVVGGHLAPGVLRRLPRLPRRRGGRRHRGRLRRLHDRPEARGLRRRRAAARPTPSPRAPRTSPDVDAASTNFDSLSYAKGNSALRQLVTWIGDDAFFAGVNAYLSRHRWGNATLDDFVAALDDARPTATSGAGSRAGCAAPASTRSASRVTTTGRSWSARAAGPHRLRVATYDDVAARAWARAFVDVGDEPVRLPGRGGRSCPTRPGRPSPGCASTSGRGRRCPRALGGARAGHPGPALDDRVRPGVDRRARRRRVPRPGDPTPPDRADAVDRRRGAPMVARPPAPRSSCRPRARRQHWRRWRGPPTRRSPRTDDDAQAVVLTRYLAGVTTDADRLRGWIDTDDPTLRWMAVHRLAALGAPRRRRHRGAARGRRHHRGGPRRGRGARRDPDRGGEGGGVGATDRGRAPVATASSRPSAGGPLGPRAARPGRRRTSTATPPRRRGSAIERGPTFADQLGDAFPAVAAHREPGRGARDRARGRRADAAPAALGGPSRRRAAGAPDRLRRARRTSW